MCDYDYEEPAFDRREWRTARKTHRCVACAETIRPKDRYHLTVIVREKGDKPDSWRHCARCWMVCEALWKANDGGAIELNCGELWADNFSADEPAELAFMTKDEAQKAVREHYTKLVTKGEDA